MPQSAQKSSLARLPSKLLANTDEPTRFFIGWWRRMHQRRKPLVAVSLKYVEWAEEGGTTQRYVWEVCRWPKGQRGPRGRFFDWTFICWMVDGVGMWLKTFPSKREAIGYYCQAPAVVMARAAQPTGDDVREGAPA